MGSFGNKKTLTDRFPDDQYLNDVDSDKIEGANSIGADVSDEIFQQTGIIPPESPVDAPGMLRGIWCDIVLSKTIKWQTNISEEELKRRAQLLKDAYAKLDKIRTGEITLKDSAGNILNPAQASPVLIQSIIGHRINGLI